MSLPVNDTFTRADENPLAGNYTHIVGGSATLNLASNGLVCALTADSEAAYYWNADTFANDQWGSIDAIVFGGSGGSVGVNLRADNTGGSVRTHYICHGGNIDATFLKGSAIIRRLAGVKTTLTSEAVTDWGTPPFTVYAEINGQLINVRQGGASGTIVSTANDIGGIASGNVGPYGTVKASGADTFMDNFKANNIPFVVAWLKA